ncbi:MAG: sigma-54-dependent Fis family transcriptional regulator, partial [Candidatus Omnitrophica bacterium]|nr:sigma-54-dependent Fis family transcriptional regulator [Candidatus Omnitrophota bacterium]
MPENKEKILVVDDEDSIRFFLKEALEPQGYLIETASSGEEAVAKVKVCSYAVVIMDIKMSGMSGFEAIEQIKKINEDLVVIILTTHGTEKMGIEAVEKGAYDYFTKPFDIDKMRSILCKGIQRYHENLKVRQLQEEVEKEYQFSNIVGKSQQMARIFKTIKKVATTNITVLVYGESGTGKELAARAIHYNGPRHQEPFIEMNCAAIPETLLESELFGYEKGAFTGAGGRKPGKFELADKGTLFLDEVGDMSLLTQSKLLRILEDKEFERVGGVTSIKVDVRIIAATNKDLLDLVQKKMFREDLYFRLNVVSITLPPLRERREDITYLFDYFMKKFSEKFGRKIKNISMEAMEVLMNYHWPGNVREFENVLQRAIILEEGDTITVEHLPDILPAAAAAHSDSLSGLVKNKVNEIE